jgi:hypothetical protein
MKTIKLDDGEYEVMKEIPYHSDDYIVLRKLPSNPMPSLSVGDWYRVGRNTSPFLWQDDPSDVRARDGNEITEIRFADGRPSWRRS